MMNVAAYQPVRTKLGPGEMQRYGGPVNTAVTPETMMPYGRTPSTIVGREGLGPFSRAANTALSRGELAFRGAIARPPQDSGQSEHDRLTHQAQRLVSQTFFGTLLKQMHDSPFKSELFSGGRGGEAFSALYDQHLADRMARAAGRKLVKSIVKHIERGRARAGAESGGGTGVEIFKGNGA